MGPHSLARPHWPPSFPSSINSNVREIINIRRKKREARKRRRRIKEKRKKKSTQEEEGERERNGEGEEEGRRKGKGKRKKEKGKGKGKNTNKKFSPSQVAKERFKDEEFDLGWRCQLHSGPPR